METKIKCMFLDWRTGTNDDGNSYYQGNFLDLYSNRPFKLYFKDDQKLKQMKPRQDYEIAVYCYINSKGLWALKVVE